MPKKPTRLWWQQVVEDMDSSPRTWVGPPRGITKRQAVKLYADWLGCEPLVGAVRAAALAHLEEQEAAL